MLAVALLQLLALSGAAIAQPLLDEFGKAPEVFVRAGASTGEIVLFALAIALLPPLALWAVEVVVALTAGETFRHRTHLVILTALATLFFVRLLRVEWGVEHRPLLLGALALGTALVGALSVRVVREWLSFAAALPVITVAMFLFVSPISGVISSAGSGAAPAPVSIVTSGAQLPSIVMVVLDELPLVSLLDANGRIDARWFPGFASLANDARWFRNTTSVGDRTAFAVPAILTGRYPRRGERAPTWSEYPKNIFRLLGAAYSMRVSESVTKLCADSYCSPSIKVKTTATRSRAAPTPTTTREHAGLGTLLSMARDEYRGLVSLSRPRVAPEATLGEETATSTTTTRPPAIAPARAATETTKPEFTGAPNGFAPIQPETQTPRFATLLDGIQPDEAPTFHFLHVLLPHGPWHLFRSGAHHAVPPQQLQIPGYDRSNWVSDPNAAALERRRHLLQLGYTDRLIERLVARLRATGVWQKSIVVVTADHGAGFTPGAGFRALDDRNQPEVLGVPLFVHAPNLTPGLDDRAAQTIDIVPTIAGLLGVTIPWRVDGRSLDGPPRARPAEHLVGFAADFSGNVQIKTVSVARHLDDVLALAAARRLPSPGTDRDLAILRTGPRGDLLRQTISSMHRGTDERRRSVRLDFPARDAFGDVVAGNDMPLLLEGTLNNGRVGDVVVFAINDRVAGVAEVFAIPGDEHRVVALLDPHTFRHGRNGLAAFVLDAGGALEAIPV